MSNKLRDKIYDMSNHFLPLDMFYNDIENMAKYPSFNQESAFKDLEKIADFVLDLQSQLAEKEKERELDNSFWKQECDSLQKTLAEKDKEIENLTEELDDKNFCRDFVDLYTENRLKTQLLNENWKDKISFTIQQLEKVKNKIESKVESIYKILDDLNIKIVGESTSRELNAYEEIAKDIDNQINDLKGKVE